MRSLSGFLGRVKERSAAKGVLTITKGQIKAVAGAPSEAGDEERRRDFLSSFTPEDDKRIMGKIDYTNAAAVQVLQVGEERNVLTELNMTTKEYNWVRSIYFISYIVLEVPSNLLQKRLTPRLWQSRIMLTWGIVLACHAAVQNKHALYALRFLLGLCEAGIFPGIAAQLCSWDRSDEMATPIMWMIGFQNTVYLLGGLCTILFSGVIFLVLPDWPKSERTKKWLTEREQEYVETRLSENAPKESDPGFDKGEVIAALKDQRTYSFMISQIPINFAGYALSWQLPTMTTSLGFAGLPRNQLLNIPPAVASVLAIIFLGWFLKKAYMTRPAYIMSVIMGPMLLFFILLAVLDSKVGIYITCIFGTMSYAVYFIPFWACTLSLKGMTGSAFTLAFQSCVGQVGGTPFAICAAVVGVAWLTNGWTWWLTLNVEYDVLCVRRLRIKEEKQGRIYAGEDVQFYEGVGRKKEQLQLQV
ncbi:major facilitator superfamily domain-containing protein [Aspergillus falconensis]